MGVRESIVGNRGNRVFSHEGSKINDAARCCKEIWLSRGLYSTRTETNCRRESSNFIRVQQLSFQSAPGTLSHWLLSGHPPFRPSIRRVGSVLIKSWSEHQYIATSPMFLSGPTGFHQMRTHARTLRTLISSLREALVFSWLNLKAQLKFLVV